MDSGTGIIGLAANMQVYVVTITFSTHTVVLWIYVAEKLNLLHKQSLHVSLVLHVYRHGNYYKVDCLGYNTSRSFYFDGSIVCAYFYLLLARWNCREFAVYPISFPDLYAYVTYVVFGWLITHQVQYKKTDRYWCRESGAT